MQQPSWLGCNRGIAPPSLPPECPATAGTFRPRFEELDTRDLPSTVAAVGTLPNGTPVVVVAQVADNALNPSAPAQQVAADVIVQVGSQVVPVSALTSAPSVQYSQGQPVGLTLTATVPTPAGPATLTADGTTVALVTTSGQAATAALTTANIPQNPGPGPGYPPPLNPPPNTPIDAVNYMLLYARGVQLLAQMLIDQQEINRLSEQIAIIGPFNP